ncbi:hypothetical protein JMJ35_003209 [Cladonia borealis]|uniref:Major facilitator superfamily (MFS) profile domain-containing protein n=1 Tax=Cladonia borealis TaxID=184061 RepID=A0AA39R4A2_9LECA|nr:hypothetical protein JMJ35_003209 [Cladonia borealis]
MRDDACHTASTAAETSYELSTMADEDEDANAPLITDGDRPITINNNGSIPLQESNNTSPTAFIWALTFAAGISGLLFGYDTGVISSTLVSIGSDLGHPLTTLDMGLITSCTSLGALIASPVTGILADRYGRKVIILVADVLFIAGALGQAAIASVPGMVAGRTIVGFAVGGASLVVPLYISELSPSAFRGRLVTLSILFITLGQVVAYLVGYALSRQRHGWRYMVGLGSAPAVLQFCLIVLLPESPRWLVKAGKVQEARGILRRVYGAGDDGVVENVLRAIKTEISEEEATSGEVSTAVEGTRMQKWIIQIRNRFQELFHVGVNRRALTIACLLQGLQQLCGFNSLMYFSATIFSLLNFSSPTLTSLSIALTNFLCTLIALLIIDHIGRRRIILLSIPIMTIGLLTCSIAYEMLGRPDLSADTPTTQPPRSPWAILILLSLTLYVSAYAIGIGNIAWQQSELFPLSVRSLGSGIATATNWGSNFLVGLTFLPMMQYIGPVWTFAIYAGIFHA